MQDGNQGILTDGKQGPATNDKQGPHSRSAGSSFTRTAALLIGMILLVTVVAASTIVFVLPKLSVLAMLAYCFGCRHGIDADHIAAIDNVTRRLVTTSGRKTMTVGVWFSLGHCFVVVCLCAMVIAGASTTSSQFAYLADLGAAIGPWIAAVVLLALGAINAHAACSLLAQWRERRAWGHEHELASLVANCCPALFESIDRPSRVFWIGLLFGLGLDTATEIAMLTTTAIAQPDVPPACALVLPLLFATGMALVDSLNTVLLLWAQEWATSNGPMHRLYFSLFLAVSSSALGIGIGLVMVFGEVAVLVGPPDSQLRQALLWPSDHLEYIGIGAVAAFLIAITCAVLCAHRFVPSREECEEETRTKLRESLLRYVNNQEYIVRFE